MNKKGSVFFYIVSAIVLLGFSVFTVVAYMSDKHFKLIFFVSTFIVLIILSSYFFTLKCSLKNGDEKLNLLTKCLEKSEHKIFKTTKRDDSNHSEKNNQLIVLEGVSEYSETVKYICRALSEI